MTDMKTTAGKIEDLEAKLAQSQAPLGEVPAARTHINALFKDGSFVETDALARHRSTAFGREHDRPYTDGVITGYGMIDGRKVCAYVQDDTIFDGTMGEVYGEKVVKLYDLAIKTGVPMIAIVAGDKPRAQEGIVTLAMQARILERATRASGLIPQVTLVLGESKEISQVAALADVVVAKDGDLFDVDPLPLVRQALAYLPQNNRAEAPRTEATLAVGAIADNITDADRELNEMAELDLRAIVDNVFESSLELGAAVAGVYTAFARLEGRSVGVVATTGTLDDAAAAQAARFVRLCDAFNLPIVELVDAPAVDASATALSKLIHAYAAATVGKVTVNVGRAFGAAYVALGSKDLGADLAYAWPTAELAVANGEALAAELGVDAAAADEFLTPYQAAERGLVDAVIEPAATRGYLVEALRLLERKLVATPAKKHGNIAL